MATLTAKELATELNTDPRTVRKFLRSLSKENETATPGKGSRWAIEKKEVRSLRTKFNKWDADRTPAPEVEEIDDEVIDTDED